MTQAIARPFDLGRPKGCKPDAYSGYSRFNPKPIAQKKKAGKRHAKKHGKKKATTKRK